MSVYQATLDLLRQLQVHPEIAAQVLAYLFFFSGTLLFNQLLDQGEAGPGARPGDAAPEGAVRGRGPATGPGRWGRDGSTGTSPQHPRTLGLGPGPQGRIPAAGLDHAPLHLGCGGCHSPCPLPSPPSSWRGAQKRASRLGNQKASRLSSEASSGGARAQGTRWPGGGQASRPHLPCTPRPLSELLPLAPRRPGLRPAAAAPGLDEERRLRGGGRALLPEAFLHPPPAGHAPRPAHPGRRTRRGRWGWGPHAVALGSPASKPGGGRGLRSEAGKWPHSAPSPCPTPATPLGQGLCRGGGQRA